VAAVAVAAAAAAAAQKVERADVNGRMAEFRAP